MQHSQEPLCLAQAVPSCDACNLCHPSTAYSAWPLLVAIAGLSPVSFT